MEKYRLILESQLGPREGILQLTEDKGKAEGTLTLLGYENPVSGEWLSEDTLRLSHSLHTQVSDLICVSLLRIDNDKIVGTLKNETNVMKWHGESMTEKKGKGVKDGES